MKLFEQFANENYKEKITSILDGLVKSYIYTATWVEDNEENFDELYDEYKVEVGEDILDFFDKVSAELGASEAYRLFTIEGSDLDYLLPHDLFLTRNGHGSGFWDKSEIYDEHSELLSKIAKELKEDDRFYKFEDEDVFESSEFEEKVEVDVDFVITDDEVTAVFLNYKENNGYTCYAHIGQHSICDEDWYLEQEKATPEQYQDLAKELENRGYILNIINHG